MLAGKNRLRTESSTVRDHRQESRLLGDRLQAEIRGCAAPAERDTLDGQTIATIDALAKSKNQISI
jgi:hypothetical protein